MIDVIVAGAGPAGSVAALVLASLGLSGGPLDGACRLDGMVVSGPRVQVRAAYPAGQAALALPRARFDLWLAEAAVAAGARLECRARVRGPIWREPGAVAGVEIAQADGRVVRVPALLTIAADGRRSVLARAAGLSRHPPAPRRWAFGVYATGVAGMTSMGEMHVRPRHYVGLAPLGGGVTNVCVVTGARPPGRTPIEVMRLALDADARLRERTAAWRPTGPPQVLGPLAVDSDSAGCPGLLLAGDAAGFVDPMTGDGLHLAIRGGLLAALAALEALDAGDVMSAAARLTARRREVLGAKLRFNRWMRRLVESPAAMDVVGAGARIAPSLLRQVVRYAGDAA